MKYLHICTNPTTEAHWDKHKTLKIEQNANGRFHVNDEVIKKNETVFEDIRKESFSYLPSRLYCIYLTDEENIEFWYDYFQNEAKTNFPIYEFEIYDDVVLHQTYVAWTNIIHCDAPYEEVKEYAQYYWNANESQNKIKEILCKGTLTVKKKYKNLQEFKNS